MMKRRTTFLHPRPQLTSRLCMRENVLASIVRIILSNRYSNLMSSYFENVCDFSSRNRLQDKSSICIALQMAEQINIYTHCYAVCSYKNRTETPCDRSHI